jgi:hypothetical protein
MVGENDQKGKSTPYLHHNELIKHLVSSGDVQSEMGGDQLVSSGQIEREKKAQIEARKKK